MRRGGRGEGVTEEGEMQESKREDTRLSSGRGGDDRGRCQQLGKAGRGSRVDFYLPIVGAG